MRRQTQAASIGLCAILLLFFLFCGCRKEVDTVLNVEFTYSVIDSNYSVPARVVFFNKTKGALFYRWSFQNGSPLTSDYKDPGFVTFSSPGPVTVKLEAWNDGERTEKTVILVLDTVPKAAFSALPLINDISPADWDFAFNGEGATAFKWTFENGSPSVSTDRHPKQIHYALPGTYRVSLQVKNGRGKWDTASKTITVLPPLNASFDIVPSFDDEDDYEAPLTAKLANHTVSATLHQWQAQGGNLSSSDDSLPTVAYAAAGTYTVSYKAGNGKQTQTVSKTITVNPNSGLRTFFNIRLGINTAHDSIGSFFSTYLRRVIKKDAVTAMTGPRIDLCYFGLSESFSFNKFLSPTEVRNWTFAPIPGATITAVTNRQEGCGCAVLSASDFDAVTTGSAFDPLNISAVQSSADVFDKGQLPRVVLFKNAAGKKGAVKIKQYVAGGAASYLLCDIKVQKD